MRTSLRNLLILAMVSAVWGSMLAGCSESRSRRDGKKLSQAVHDAQRAQQRAAVLLSGTGYRETKTGELSPLAAPLAPSVEQAASAAGRVELLVGQVHPEAAKLLADARAKLEGAISNNARPPAENCSRQSWRLQPSKSSRATARRRRLPFSHRRYRCSASSWACRSLTLPRTTRWPPISPALRSPKIL